MTELEDRRIRQFKIAVITGGFVVILILILMMISESQLRDWERYQENYQAILGDKAPAENTIRIRQIENPELQLVDRCPTCHIGLHDSRMTDQPLPLTLHSGKIFTSHDPEYYGCSTCHGGRGRALDIPHAHDQTVNNAFLPKNQTEAYCGKCHLTVFPAEFNLEGAKHLKNGRTVFQNNGCQGCHKIRGVGGILGPDLTDLGSRTLHSFDFRHIRGDRTISNWHREHLRRPREIVTGSIMPAFDIPEQKIDDLVIFLRGQFNPHFPLQYIALPMIREFKNERSAIPDNEIFSRLCAGCHGASGLPDSTKQILFPVPTLANPDFQAVASIDFIAFTLTEGRGGRYMNAWIPEVSGLFEEETQVLIAAVRSMRSEPPDINRIKRSTGSITAGENSFIDNCAMCHKSGEGTRLAPNILSDGFLTLATDTYILTNIINGRDNTAMPAWRSFSEQQLADLLVYLRSNQTGSMRPLPYMHIDGNVSRGDSLFYYRLQPVPWRDRCRGNRTGDTEPGLSANDRSGFYRRNPDLWSRPYGHVWPDRPRCQ